MSNEDGNRDRERESKDDRDDRVAAFPLNLPAREDVVDLHDDTVREHGGSLGIRDENALRSALARPQNMLLYGRDLDLFDLAASLAHGIMRSHPFQDGNKRASWIASALKIDPLSASKIDPPKWGSSDGVGVLRAGLIHALCTVPRASDTRAGRCARGG